MTEQTHGPGCGCGCGTLQILEPEPAQSTCECGCCTPVQLSRDEEIAELRRLKERAEQRLAELEGA